MLLKNQVLRKHAVDNEVGLSEIVQYQNQAVVAYFCSRHPEFTVQEGNILFTDLLSWMWFNAQRAKLGKKTHLFGPLLLLDELWHAFILHTRDYVNFSMHYFGGYFHHDIEPIGSEHVMEEEELTDYLQDCFTYLGTEWVSRRFEVALVETS
ncbi:hypothetical protein Lgra_2748 [Legionella gratiana]|uniref:Uncharacterized conserved protein n=1 Tax=Legionella gratiana TaxID=45066 RepID=A0A378J561_9GAMM|nr:hypothetical protein [Legionella gratiana]KTD05971.1 hypothetical protein Lgra_2748 [Legionella gratiana]STX42546.1 Uncharacterized conserved protein [Legionella gratiana]